jgi:hypothetical protein
MLGVAPLAGISATQKRKTSACDAKHYPKSDQNGKGVDSALFVRVSYGRQHS